MKKTYFILMLWCCWCGTQHTSAQGWCLGDGTVVLENVEHSIADETVVYKTAPSIDEWDIPFSDNLNLRVFYPTDLTLGERRPLVILIHGGFFIGGDYSDFSPYAEAYARKGFVAATVGYRLCKRSDCLIGGATGYPCAVSWGNSLLPSAYAAATDINDAIRFLQNGAAQYHIDPNQVIVGGHSAGAITALHAAFLDQDEVQSICSGCGVWPDYLAEPLDPVDGIKAILPMSGMLYDLDWIDADEMDVAAVLLHGTNDGITPYDCDDAVECCSGVPFPVMCGACPIAQRIDDLGGSYELITGKGASHDISVGGFYNTAQPEIIAFLIKTLQCGASLQRHIIIDVPQQAVCPGPPYDVGTAAEVCLIAIDEPFNAIANAIDSRPEASSDWVWNISHNQDYWQINCFDNRFATTGVQLTVTDLLGRVCYQQKMTDDSQQIAVSAWAKGLYVVQLADARGQLLGIKKVLHTSYP